MLYMHTFTNKGNPASFKVAYTPNGHSAPKRLIFVILYNDLIEYFIVCFEHQCNTMHAF